MIIHLALVLLIPAALLTWRWSRLVSAALWLTLAVWLAYRGIRWQWPEVWTAGHLEWMRGVSMVTGLIGATELRRRARLRERKRWLRDDLHWLHFHGMAAIIRPDDLRFAHITNTSMQERTGRPDILAALLVASMGVDLTAWLIHRGAGQWGPQPFFQVGVLLAMCAVSAWPRRK